MDEAFISVLLDHFVSITSKQAIRQLKLVTGVDEEVKNITSNLRAIQAVLEDAEERQVKDKAVKLWLAELKDVSYDIDDVLGEWNSQFLQQQIVPTEETRVTEVSLLKKVRSFILSSCFCVRQVGLRRGIALKIEEVDKRLVNIANRRSRFNFTSEMSSHHEQIRYIPTSSVIDESEVFVRDEDEEAIKDMLFDCESSNGEGKRNPPIISVVGMGGIGKTTLTRLTFNDPEIESHFDKRIWVCVSDPFDEGRIALEILESLLGEKPNLVRKDNILREISKCCSGKKILLVLDDVWTENSNDYKQLITSFRKSSPESRILVTTRKEMVGKVMGSRSGDMFMLGKLSEDKCWSLFCHQAFSGWSTEEREKFEDMGKRIVERCIGLPLAVKTLGGLLQFKAKEHVAKHLREPDVGD